MTIQEARLVLGEKAVKLSDEEILVLIQLVEMSLDAFERKIGLERNN